MDIIRYFPLRLGRFINHIGKGLQQLPEVASISRQSALFWWLELFLYFFDLIGLMEVYESLADFVKFNTRPLHNWELNLAKSVYGNSIRYHRVRIDNNALIGPKQFNLCYVSAFTINSWGYMSNSILIHELMHIWQYQKIGLVYIPQALRAYHSSDAYNYGGLKKLLSIKNKGGDIWDFNLEQQADIIADYYLIQNRHKPNWGEARIFDVATYEYFLSQVRSPK